MPAKSQAQRAYLNARFGHQWVQRHHFDNRGKLPAHVGGQQVEENTPGDMDETTLPKLVGKAKKAPPKKSGKKTPQKTLGGTVKGNHMKGHGNNHLFGPC